MKKYLFLVVLIISFDGNPLYVGKPALKNDYQFIKTVIEHPDSLKILIHDPRNHGVDFRYDFYNRYNTVKLDFQEYVSKYLKSGYTIVNDTVDSFRSSYSWDKPDYTYYHTLTIKGITNDKGIFFTFSSKDTNKEFKFDYYELLDVPSYNNPELQKNYQFIKTVIEYPDSFAIIISNPEYQTKHLKEYFTSKSDFKEFTDYVLKYFQSGYKIVKQGLYRRGSNINPGEIIGLAHHILVKSNKFERNIEFQFESTYPCQEFKFRCYLLLDTTRHKRFDP